MQTAQQLNSGIAAVLLVVTAGLAGCEVRPRPPGMQAVAAAQTAGRPNAEPPILNVGVVLADRLGYACFSFSDIGLTDEAVVENLQSSCECVKPSLIHYLAADQQGCTGVLLEFIPGWEGRVTSLSVHPEVRAARLGINVDLKLAGGKTHRFVVDLLYTVPTVRGKSDA